MSAGICFNDGQVKPAAFATLEFADEVFCFLKASVGDGGAELSSKYTFILGRSVDGELAVSGGGSTTVCPGHASPPSRAGA